MVGLQDNHVLILERHPEGVNIFYKKFYKSKIFDVVQYKSIFNMTAMSLEATKVLTYGTLLYSRGFHSNNKLAKYIL